MFRRTVITGLGLSGLAMVAANLAEAVSPSTGTPVFGAAKGAIGSKLAEMTLVQLRQNYDLDYSLVINEARSGRSAVESVQRSRPDGTTLLQAQSSSIVLFPSTYKSLSYDPIKDFTPLTILGTYGYSLVLGAAIPIEINTVESYLEWVTHNPDMREVGFTLYGSQAHLLCEMLAREGGVAIRSQGYASASSIFNDLANGTIGAAIAVNGNVPLLTKKGVRVVAITNDERLVMQPETKTFSESGFPALNLTGWYGWFAPSKTPPVVIAEQSKKLSDLTEGKEYAMRLNSLLLDRNTAKPDQIVELINQEIEKYAKLAKEYHISILT